MYSNIEGKTTKRVVRLKLPKYTRTPLPRTDISSTHTPVNSVMYSDMGSATGSKFNFPPIIPQEFKDSTEGNESTISYTPNEDVTHFKFNSSRTSLNQQNDVSTSDIYTDDINDIDLLTEPFLGEEEETTSITSSTRNETTTSIYEKLLPTSSESTTKRKNTTDDTEDETSFESTTFVVPTELEDEISHTVDDDDEDDEGTTKHLISLKLYKTTRLLNISSEGLRPLTYISNTGIIIPTTSLINTETISSDLFLGDKSQEVTNLPASTSTKANAPVSEMIVPEEIDILSEPYSEEEQTSTVITATTGSTTSIYESLLPLTLQKTTKQENTTDDTFDHVSETKETTFITNDDENIETTVIDEHLEDIDEDYKNSELNETNIVVNGTAEDIFHLQLPTQTSSVEGEDSTINILNTEETTSIMQTDTEYITTSEYTLLSNDGQVKSSIESETKETSNLGHDHIVSEELKYSTEIITNAQISKEKNTPSGVDNTETQKLTNIPPKDEVTVETFSPQYTPEYTTSSLEIATAENLDLEHINSFTTGTTPSVTESASYVQGSTTNATKESPLDELSTKFLTPESGEGRNDIDLETSESTASNMFTLSTYKSVEQVLTTTAELESSTKFLTHESGEGRNDIDLETSESTPSNMLTLSTYKSVEQVLTTTAEFESSSLTSQTYGTNATFSTNINFPKPTESMVTSETDDFGELITITLYPTEDRDMEELKAESTGETDSFLGKSPMSLGNTTRNIFFSQNFNENRSFETEELYGTTKFAESFSEKQTGEHFNVDSSDIGDQNDFKITTFSSFLDEKTDVVNGTTDEDEKSALEVLHDIDALLNIFTTTETYGFNYMIKNVNNSYNGANIITEEIKLEKPEYNVVTNTELFLKGVDEYITFSTGEEKQSIMTAAAHEEISTDTEKYLDLTSDEYFGRKNINTQNIAGNSHSGLKYQLFKNDSIMGYDNTIGMQSEKPSDIFLTETPEFFTNEATNISALDNESGFKVTTEDTEESIEENQADEMSKMLASELDTPIDKQNISDYRDDSSRSGTNTDVTSNSQLALKNELGIAITTTITMDALTLQQFDRFKTISQETSTEQYYISNVEENEPQTSTGIPQNIEFKYKDAENTFKVEPTSAGNVDIDGEYSTLHFEVTTTKEEINVATPELITSTDNLLQITFEKAAQESAYFAKVTSTHANEHNEFEYATEHIQHFDEIHKTSHRLDHAEIRTKGNTEGEIIHLRKSSTPEFKQPTTHRIPSDLINKGNKENVHKTTQHYKKTFSKTSNEYINHTNFPIEGPKETDLYFNAGTTKPCETCNHTDTLKSTQTAKHTTTKHLGSEHSDHHSDILTTQPIAVTHSLEGKGSSKVSGHGEKESQSRKTSQQEESKTSFSLEHRIPTQYLSESSRKYTEKEAEIGLSYTETSSVEESIKNVTESVGTEFVTMHSAQVPTAHEKVLSKVLTSTVPQDSGQNKSGFKEKTESNGVPIHTTRHSKEYTKPRPEHGDEIDGTVQVNDGTERIQETGVTHLEVIQSLQPSKHTEETKEHKGIEWPEEERKTGYVVTKSTTEVEIEHKTEHSGETIFENITVLEHAGTEKEYKSPENLTKPKHLKKSSTELAHISEASGEENFHFHNNVTLCEICQVTKIQSGSRIHITNPISKGLTQSNVDSTVEQQFESTKGSTSSEYSEQARITAAESEHKPEHDQVMSSGRQLTKQTKHLEETESTASSMNYKQNEVEHYVGTTNLEVTTGQSEITQEKNVTEHFGETKSGTSSAHSGKTEIEHKIEGMSTEITGQEVKNNFVSTHRSSTGNELTSTEAEHMSEHGAEVSETEAVMIIDNSERTSEKMGKVSTTFEATEGKMSFEEKNETEHFGETKSGTFSAHSGKTEIEHKIEGMSTEITEQEVKNNSLSTHRSSTGNELTSTEAEHMSEHGAEVIETEAVMVIENSERTSEKMGKVSTSFEATEGKMSFEEKNETEPFGETKSGTSSAHSGKTEIEHKIEGMITEITGQEVTNNFVSTHRSSTGNELTSTEAEHMSEHGAEVSETEAVMVIDNSEHTSKKIEKVSTTFEPTEGKVSFEEKNVTEPFGETKSGTSSAHSGKTEIEHKIESMSTEITEQEVQNNFVSTHRSSTGNELTSSEAEHMSEHGSEVSETEAVMVIENSERTSEKIGRVSITFEATEGKVSFEEKNVTENFGETEREHKIEGISTEISEQEVKNYYVSTHRSSTDNELTSIEVEHMSEHGAEVSETEAVMVIENSERTSEEMEKVSTTFEATEEQESFEGVEHTEGKQSESVKGHEGSAEAERTSEQIKKVSISFEATEEREHPHPTESSLTLKGAEHAEGKQTESEVDHESYKFVETEHTSQHIETISSTFGSSEAEEPTKASDSSSALEGVEHTEEQHTESEKGHEDFTAPDRTSGQIEIVSAIIEATEGKAYPTPSETSAALDGAEHTAVIETKSEVGHEGFRLDEAELASEQTEKVSSTFGAPEDKEHAKSSESSAALEGVERTEEQQIKLEPTRTTASPTYFEQPEMGYKVVGTGTKLPEEEGKISVLLMSTVSETLLAEAETRYVAVSDSSMFSTHTDYTEKYVSTDIEHQTERSEEASEAIHSTGYVNKTQINIVSPHFEQTEREHEVVDTGTEISKQEPETGFITMHISSTGEEHTSTKTNHQFEFSEGISGTIQSSEKMESFQGTLTNESPTYTEQPELDHTAETTNFTLYEEAVNRSLLPSEVSSSNGKYILEDTVRMTEQTIEVSGTFHTVEATEKPESEMLSTYSQQTDREHETQAAGTEVVHEGTKTTFLNLSSISQEDTSIQPEQQTASIAEVSAIISETKHINENGSSAQFEQTDGEHNVIDITADVPEIANEVSFITAHISSSSTEYQSTEAVYKSDHEEEVSQVTYKPEIMDHFESTENKILSMLSEQIETEVQSIVTEASESEFKSTAAIKHISIEKHTSAETEYKSVHGEEISDNSEVHVTEQKEYMEETKTNIPSVYSTHTELKPKTESMNTEVAEEEVKSSIDMQVSVTSEVSILTETEFTSEYFEKTGSSLSSMSSEQTEVTGHELQEMTEMSGAAAMHTSSTSEKYMSVQVEHEPALKTEQVVESDRTHLEHKIGGITTEVIKTDFATILISSTSQIHHKSEYTEEVTETGHAVGASEGWKETENSISEYSEIMKTSSKEYLTGGEVLEELKITGKTMQATLTENPVTFEHEHVTKHIEKVSEFFYAVETTEKSQGTESNLSSKPYEHTETQHKEGSGGTELSEERTKSTRLKIPGTSKKYESYETESKIEHNEEVSTIKNTSVPAYISSISEEHVSLITEHELEYSKKISEASHLGERIKSTVHLTEPKQVQETTPKLIHISEGSVEENFHFSTHITLCEICNVTKIVNGGENTFPKESSPAPTHYFAVTTTLQEVSTKESLEETKINVSLEHFAKTESGQNISGLTTKYSEGEMETGFATLITSSTGENITSENTETTTTIAKHTDLEEKIKTSFETTHISSSSEELISFQVEHKSEYGEQVNETVATQVTKQFGETVINMSSTPFELPRIATPISSTSVNHMGIGEKYSQVEAVTKGEAVSEQQTERSKETEIISLESSEEGKLEQKVGGFGTAVLEEEAKSSILTSTSKVEAEHKLEHGEKVSVTSQQIEEAKCTTVTESTISLGYFEVPEKEGRMSTKSVEYSKEESIATFVSVTPTNLNEGYKSVEVEHSTEQYEKVSEASQATEQTEVDHTDEKHTESRISHPGYKLLETEHSLEQTKKVGETFETTAGKEHLKSSKSSTTLEGVEHTEGKQTDSQVGNEGYKLFEPEHTSEQIEKASETFEVTKEKDHTKPSESSAALEVSKPAEGKQTESKVGHEGYKLVEAELGSEQIEKISSTFGPAKENEHAISSESSSALEGIEHTEEQQTESEGHESFTELESTSEQAETASASVETLEEKEYSKPIESSITLEGAEYTEEKQTESKVAHADYKLVEADLMSEEIEKISSTFGPAEENEHAKSSETSSAFKGIEHTEEQQTKSEGHENYTEHESSSEQVETASATIEAAQEEDHSKPSESFVTLEGADHSKGKQIESKVSHEGYKVVEAQLTSEPIEKVSSIFGPAEENEHAKSNESSSALEGIEHTKEQQTNSEGHESYTELESTSEHVESASVAVETVEEKEHSKPSESSVTLEGAEYTERKQTESKVYHEDYKVVEAELASEQIEKMSSTFGSAEENEHAKSSESSSTLEGIKHSEEQQIKSEGHENYTELESTSEQVGTASATIEAAQEKELSKPSKSSVTLEGAEYTEGEDTESKVGHGGYIEAEQMKRINTTVEATDERDHPKSSEGSAALEGVEHTEGEQAESEVGHEGYKLAEAQFTSEQIEEISSTFGSSEENEPAKVSENSSALEGVGHTEGQMRESEGGREGLAEGDRTSEQIENVSASAEAKEENKHSKPTESSEALEGAEITEVAHAESEFGHEGYTEGVSEQSEKTSTTLETTEEMEHPKPSEGSAALEAIEQTEGKHAESEIGHDGYTMVEAELTSEPIGKMSSTFGPGEENGHATSSASSSALQEVERTEDQQAKNVNHEGYTEVGSTLEQIGNVSAALEAAEGNESTTKPSESSMTVEGAEHTERKQTEIEVAHGGYNGTELTSEQIEKVNSTFRPSVETEYATANESSSVLDGVGHTEGQQTESEHGHEDFSESEHTSEQVETIGATIEATEEKEHPRPSEISGALEGVEHTERKQTEGEEGHEGYTEVEQTSAQIEIVSVTIEATEENEHPKPNESSFEGLEHTNGNHTETEVSHEGYKLAKPEYTSEQIQKTNQTNEATEEIQQHQANQTSVTGEYVEHTEGKPTESEVSHESYKLVEGELTSKQIDKISSTVEATEQEEHLKPNESPSPWEVVEHTEGKLTESEQVHEGYTEAERPSGQIETVSANIEATEEKEHTELSESATALEEVEHTEGKHTENTDAERISEQIGSVRTFEASEETKHPKPSGNFTAPEVDEHFELKPTESGIGHVGYTFVEAELTSEQIEKVSLTFNPAEEQEHPKPIESSEAMEMIQHTDGKQTESVGSHQIYTEAEHTSEQIENVSATFEAAEGSMHPKPSENSPPLEGLEHTEGKQTESETGHEGYIEEEHTSDHIEKVSSTFETTVEKEYPKPSESSATLEGAKFTISEQIESEPGHEGYIKSELISEEIEKLSTTVEAAEEEEYHKPNGSVAALEGTENTEGKHTESVLGHEGYTEAERSSEGIERVSTSFEATEEKGNLKPSENSVPLEGVEYTETKQTESEVSREGYTLTEAERTSAHNEKVGESYQATEEATLSVQNETSSILHTSEHTEGLQTQSKESVTTINKEYVGLEIIMNETKPTPEFAAEEYTATPVSVENVKTHVHVHEELDKTNQVIEHTEISDEIKSSEFSEQAEQGYENGSTSIIPAYNIQPEEGKTEPVLEQTRFGEETESTTQHTDEKNKPELNKYTEKGKTHYEEHASQAGHVDDMTQMTEHFAESKHIEKSSSKLITITEGGVEENFHFSGGNGTLCEICNITQIIGATQINITTSFSKEASSSSAHFIDISSVSETTTLQEAFTKHSSISTNLENISESVVPVTVAKNLSMQENLNKTKTTTFSSITINLPTFFPNSSEIVVESFEHYYTTMSHSVYVIDDEEYDTTINNEQFRKMKLSDFEVITEFSPTTESFNISSEHAVNASVNGTSPSVMESGSSLVSELSTTAELGNFTGNTSVETSMTEISTTSEFSSSIEVMTSEGGYTSTVNETSDFNMTVSPYESLNLTLPETNASVPGASDIFGNTTAAFNIQITPIEIKDECNIAEFNAKKNCLCSIDSLVKDLRLKSNEKDFHKVLDNYLCPKFTPSKNGVIVGSKRSSHRRRKRSYDLEIFARQTSDVPSDDRIFGKDINLEDTDYHMYVTPGSKVKVQCIGGTNNNNSEEMANSVWTYTDGKQLTEGKIQDKDGSLIIENIIPQDGGNYTCKNGGSKYPHQISVVSLASYTIEVYILYEFPEKCTKDYVESMSRAFPIKFENMLCGETHKICFVKMNISCVQKERQYVATNITVVAEPINVILPTLDTKACKISCEQKIFSKLVSILINNIEIFETLPVFYSMETRKFELKPTPAVERKNATTEATYKPKLSLECFPGFGLIDKTHVCSACEPNTYSTGTQPVCIRCPRRQFQPMVGSKSCLSCTTYLEDPACLPLPNMDIQKFKILVASLFGTAVFLILVCCCFMCSGKKNIPSPEEEETPKSRRRRRQRSQDVEGQESVPLFDKQRRNRRYAAPPNPPPPDFE